jgi:hypothetical protein
MGAINRREFPRTTEHVGGSTRPIYRLRCSACPAEVVIPATGGGSSRSRDDIARTAMRRGLIVGHAPEYDLCLSCAERKHKEVPVTKLRSLSELNKVAAIEPAARGSRAAPPTTGSAVKAAPPKVVEVRVTNPGETQDREGPSREDKRRIMEQLNNCYGKEAYAGNWSDGAVASQLAVPRAWVVAIREEFFGPANSEADIALAKKIAELGQRITGAEAAMENLLGTIEENKRQLAALAKQVEQR